MRPWLALGSILLPAAALGGACAGHDASGPLHAERKALEREVRGLREVVELLERGDPVIPPRHVAVVIDESLLRDLLAAQLPFEADLDRYHVRLMSAEVTFRGSPQVRLRGTLGLGDNPALAGEVSVRGALEGIRLDEATGTLRASVGVDHLAIDRAAGLETLLSGSTLDELARALRLQITDRLPALSIPVKVQQRIRLPALSQGPLRLDAAEMPIQASISRVLAGQGRLWIGIDFRPGDLVKTADAARPAQAAQETRR